MPERYLDRLRPDMEVCDFSGEKVGTISHIYRHTEAALSASGEGSLPAAAASPAYDEVIEVKTGFLGLGSHLYIPIGAVQEVLNDCVFLSKPKAAFEELGWHDKPQHLDQLDRGAWRWELVTSQRFGSQEQDGEPSGSNLHSLRLCVPRARGA